MFSLHLHKIFIHLLGQTSVMGEDAPEKPLEEWWKDSAAPDPMLGRVILGLGIVLLLIFVTVYLIQRFYKFGHGRNARGELRVIETCPLGGKKMVHVLRVYNRTLVIGAAGDRIELLTELSDEEVTLPQHPERKGKIAFGNVLSLWNKKGEKKKQG